MPTISVIIPAYNAERTILETIASVQQQTFSDFELIMINDGSTDRTLQLLNSVIDERIKILSYKNAGVSVARNRGIAHATGEFIAFLDADDLWTPDKLELQLAALQQHPEAGVAYSWTSSMDEQGKTFYPCNHIFFKGSVYAELLVNNFLESGSNPLVRRQAIEPVRFDPTLTHGEDWELYLRLAARWPFVVVPKPQILYRQTSGSASSKIEVMKEASLIVLEKAYRVAPPELQSLKNQSLAWVYRYCADKFLQYSKHHNISDVNQAGHNLLMAICLYPQIMLETYTRNLIKWFIKKWISIRLFHKNDRNIIEHVSNL